MFTVLDVCVCGLFVPPRSAMAIWEHLDHPTLYYQASKRLPSAHSNRATMSNSSTSLVSSNMPLCILQGFITLMPGFLPTHSWHFMWPSCTFSLFLSANGQMIHLSKCSEGGRNVPLSRSLYPKMFNSLKIPVWNLKGQNIECCA